MKITDIFSTVTTIRSNQLVTGDYIRILDVGRDNPLNGQKFYVKVIDTSICALYHDSSYTRPVAANPMNMMTSGSTTLSQYLYTSTSTVRITVLNRTKATYTEFPNDWIPQPWPVTWINNQSSTVTWTNNSSNVIKWTNTL